MLGMSGDDEEHPANKSATIQVSNAQAEAEGMLT